MSNAVSMSDFGAAFTEILEVEARDAEQTLDEVIAFHALKLKGTLNKRSPKKTKRYANGWRVKTVTRNHERVKVLYNADRPDLTYRLEYGNSHQRAQPHIVPALKEEISNITGDLLDRL